MPRFGRASKVALVVLGVLAWGSVAEARGNVNVTFGPRNYTDDQWDSLDEQGGVGLWVDFGRERWPVNVSIALYEADAQGIRSTMPVEPELEVRELAAGVIWYARNEKRFRPFVGGGLTLLEAKLRLGSDESSANPGDDDRSPAAYLQVGFFHRLGKHWNLGVELRGLAASDVTLFGKPSDVDYGHAGLLVGWGW